MYAWQNNYFTKTERYLPSLTTRFYPLLLYGEFTSIIGELFRVNILQIDQPYVRSAARRQLYGTMVGLFKNWPGAKTKYETKWEWWTVRLPRELLSCSKHNPLGTHWLNRRCFTWNILWIDVCAQWELLVSPQHRSVPTEWVQRVHFRELIWSVFFSYPY